MNTTSISPGREATPSPYATAEGKSEGAGEDGFGALFAAQQAQDDTAPAPGEWGDHAAEANEASEGRFVELRPTSSGEHAASTTTADVEPRSLLGRAMRRLHDITASIAGQSTAPMEEGARDEGDEELLSDLSSVEAASFAVEPSSASPDPLPQAQAELAASHEEQPTPAQESLASAEEKEANRAEFMDEKSATFKADGTSDASSIDLAAKSVADELSAQQATRRTSSSSVKAAPVSAPSERKRQESMEGVSQVSSAVSLSSLQWPLYAQAATETQSDEGEEAISLETPAPLAVEEENAVGGELFAQAEPADGDPRTKASSVLPQTTQRSDALERADESAPRESSVSGTTRHDTGNGQPSSSALFASQKVEAEQPLTLNENEANESLSLEALPESMAAAQQASEKVESANDNGSTDETDNEQAQLSTPVTLFDPLVLQTAQAWLDHVPGANALTQAVGSAGGAQGVLKLDALNDDPLAGLSWQGLMTGLDTHMADLAPQGQDATAAELSAPNEAMTSADDSFALPEINIDAEATNSPIALSTARPKEETTDAELDEDEARTLEASAESTAPHSAAPNAANHTHAASVVREAAAAEANAPRQIFSHEVGEELAHAVGLGNRNIRLQVAPPGVGELAIDIRVIEGRVQMRVAGDAENLAATLSQQGQALQASLEAQGLTLESLDFRGGQANEQSTQTPGEQFARREERDDARESQAFERLLGPRGRPLSVATSAPAAIRRGPEQVIYVRV